jgi:hypothetical protein
LLRLAKDFSAVHEQRRIDHWTKGAEDEGLDAVIAIVDHAHF